VIRTLLIQNNRFEFQVGGAITFDSKPKEEWIESLNKAKAVAKILGIKMSNLKKI
jgi:para-aminobenzoate synthetase component 1